MLSALLLRLLSPCAPPLLPIIHLHSDVAYSSFQLRLGFVLRRGGRCWRGRGVGAAYDEIKDRELIGHNK